jgi:Bacterial extracellular solute-binding proteins, family 3
MRSFILAAWLLAGLPSAAFAQGDLPAAKPLSRLVTVLSDGLSEPAGPASQVLSELSIALDKESDVRLLAINGYGGPANVRDLLQLRGTDFAILNNDVLSYLDIASPLPDARRKVRLVAPLVHQRVLLFVRQDIKSIEGLKGHKVGFPAKLPSREVTARTIFGTLKINAEFVELNSSDAAKTADAVLLYEKDLPGLRTFGVTSATHRLLPLPVSGPLGAVYLPKKLSKGALPGFDTDALETVQVTTLLAAFDWTPKQGRYPDAITLVDRVFALAPKFRVHNPNSPFSRTDLRAPLPGWKYFGPAEGLAKAAPPVVVKDEPLLMAAPAAEQPVAAAETPALRIVAASRPPLLNAQSKDGGIVLKILASALESSGMRVSVQWADGEKAALSELFTGKSADIALFMQTTHCDSPSNQSAIEAQICDMAVLTDPLMQAVMAVFTPLDTPIDPKTAGAAQAQTLCVPENQTVPEEALEEMTWIKPGSMKIIRPKSLANCLIALQQHDVAALMAMEPEVRLALEKLALPQSFQIAQRPGATIGLHAAVAKDNPHMVELIQTINDALAKFKASNDYSAVIASHLADLTGTPMKQP